MGWVGTVEIAGLAKMARAVRRACGECWVLRCQSTACIEGVAKLLGGVGGVDAGCGVDRKKSEGGKGNRAFAAVCCVNVVCRAEKYGTGAARRVDWRWCAGALEEVEVEVQEGSA